MTTATQTRESQELIEMHLISLDKTLIEKGLHREWLPATATEPGEEIGFEVYHDEQTDSVVIASHHEHHVFPLVDGAVPMDKIERWINDYAAEAWNDIPF